jgi:hypothetical protein
LLPTEEVSHDRRSGRPEPRSTDLTTPAEDLVARYAARWAIECTFAEAREHLGAGQAQSRVRRAVERTVPFALYCYTITVVLYAPHGHHPDDAADHCRRAPWYVTKAEPSLADMAVKLRRVVIAARFRPPTQLSPPPRNSAPSSTPGPQPAPTPPRDLRNQRKSSDPRTCDKPTEGIWSLLKRHLADFDAADLTHLTRAIKRKLKKLQYRPHLIDGYLPPTGPIMDYGLTKSSDSTSST